MHDFADFEQFYRDHVDAVYGFAAARVGPGAAAGITSEVFASATRTFACGGGDTLSRAWLMTCARTRILDSWLHGAAVEAVDTTHQMATSVDPRTAVRLERTLTPVSVGAMLDRLHPAERAVLALRHLEGRPVAEVAHLLDRSVDATTVLLSQAEESFLAMIERSRHVAQPAVA